MPEIKLAKIKIKSLFKINGFYYYLNAKSGNRIVWGNAVQLKMGQEDVEYIRKLSKVNEEYISEQITCEKMLNYMKTGKEIFRRSLFKESTCSNRESSKS